MFQLRAKTISVHAQCAAIIGPGWDVFIYEMGEFSTRKDLLQVIHWMHTEGIQYVLSCDCHMTHRR